MGDLTTFVPKPMLMLNNRPILDYKISHLPKIITEVVLVVGFNRDLVHAYFGSLFTGKKITYVVQEELNGTGGALHAAKNVLEDRFMVIMGDDLYLPSDLEGLALYENALLAYPLDQDKIFGVVKFDAQGNLSQVIEKAQAYAGDLANTGAYMLTKQFFDYSLISVGKGEYGLPQTMAVMAKEVPVRVVQASKWIPVTNPSDMALAEDRLREFYPYY